MPSRWCSLPDIPLSSSSPLPQAHLSFEMQFLIDYNLAGMAFLEAPLAAVRFRRPLPEAVCCCCTAATLVTAGQADC